MFLLDGWIFPAHYEGDIIRPGGFERQVLLHSPVFTVFGARSLFLYHSVAAVSFEESSFFRGPCLSTYDIENMREKKQWFLLSDIVYLMYSTERSSWWGYFCWIDSLNPSLDLRLFCLPHTSSESETSLMRLEDLSKFCCTMAKIGYIFQFEGKMDQANRRRAFVNTNIF